MADSRTYVRLHDGLPDHPKIVAVGGEAAWLYVSALCYASRHLTDGVIPKRVVGRLTGEASAEASAQALLNVGLWHEGEHACPDCPVSHAGEYVIHDYLEHQRSASYVRELRAARSAAGRKGGRNSAASRGSSRREAKAEASASASAQANGQQASSNAESKTQAETETEESTSYFHDESRGDVEKVCQHLADRITENGSKRPAVGKTWRTAARLLIDKDGRSVDQVMAAIDWCQADPFWRANVLSMPTLRKQYDRMRLKAIADREQERQRAAKVNPAESHADKGIF